jgi:type II secretory pathway component GspD/PulD (secretin)
MPIIIDLIKQVDTSVEDITELRVFRLKYADAEETADLLSNLFTDSTSSTSNNQGFRGPIQFGGRFGGGLFGAPRAANSAAADQSSRTLKQTKVVAVADLRTSSVVVSAARDLMVQIGEMIKDLDSDPAKKQQVFVFDVQNTDPQQVQDILQSLFPAPNTGTYNSSRNASRGQNGAGNQLNNRATQNQNQGVGRGNNSGFGGMGQGGGLTGGRSFGQ